MKSDAPVSVIALTGDITHANSADWRDRILRELAQAPALILDASGVHMLSSAGLRTLLILHREAAGAGKFFALAALPVPARDVMAVTGFLRQFAVYETLEEARSAGEGSLR